jgi:hypothetical protein
MTNKRKWPSQLKPIQMRPIEEKAFDQQSYEDPRSIEEISAEIFGDELRRRVSLLLEHFGMQWPQTDDHWVAFVFELGQRAKVPNLRVSSRGPGAREKWTKRKNQQLFADVMALTRHGKLSEHAACLLIARSPARFLNRYPQNGATLHRQFLRIKSAFDKNWFVKLNRDAAIEHEIAWYSTEAERERRRRIAQQSASQKPA